MYEVHEQTDGLFAVVNADTGRVRNEGLSRAEAVGLAAELDQCEADVVVVLAG